MAATKKPVGVVTHPHRQTGTNLLEVHGVADSTRHYGSTCWRHLAPWAWQSIDEGHTAITSALRRTVDAYEASHDAVRLANELLALAAELQELQGLSEAM